MNIVGIMVTIHVREDGMELGEMTVLGTIWHILLNWQMKATQKERGLKILV